MAQPTQELIETMASLIAQALRASIEDVLTPAMQSQIGAAAASQPRAPEFTMPECHPCDDAPVAEYFDRFDCALKLSQIPEKRHALYALVHMGPVLTNALRYLIIPRDLADLQYQEMRAILIKHFDKQRNKFVESIRFRAIRQKRETVAQFARRLRQGAVHCEYGAFLDRMLIEQFLYGVEAREIRDAIIRQTPVTFDAAVDIAQRLEATRKKTILASARHNVR